MSGADLLFFLLFVLLFLVVFLVVCLVVCLVVVASQVGQTHLWLDWYGDRWFFHRHHRCRCLHVLGTRCDSNSSWLGRHGFRASFRLHAGRPIVGHHLGVSGRTVLVFVWCFSVPVSRYDGANGTDCFFPWWPLFLLLCFFCVDFVAATTATAAAAAIAQHYFDRDRLSFVGVARGHQIHFPIGLFWRCLYFGHRVLSWAHEFLHE